MIDQATELRKLVLRAMRDGSQAFGPAPRLVLLTAGHSGVGVTSLGVNLSVAMAEQGLRVVLVDAEAQPHGVAALCGLSAGDSSADLSVARRDIHEVLQRGPAGIQIVPGLRVDTTEQDARRLSMERFIRQLMKLGRYADSVVVDLGQGTSYPVRRVTQVADDVIIVTTPDNVSVADAYAHIKLSLSGAGSARLWLVVNLADEPVARDVHQRIRQSCERFLGHGIDLLGWVPGDRYVGVSVLLWTP
ncbi:MAG: MinD/ParA family protein, partial [Pirellulaceae bacterium]